jgi:hypothetical protein
MRDDSTVGGRARPVKCQPRGRLPTRSEREWRVRQQPAPNCTGAELHDPFIVLGRRRLQRGRATGGPGRCLGPSPGDDRHPIQRPDRVGERGLIGNGCLRGRRAKLPHARTMATLQPDAPAVVASASFLRAVGAGRGRSRASPASRGSRGEESSCRYSWGLPRFAWCEHAQFDADARGEVDARPPG